MSDIMQEVPETAAVELPPIPTIPPIPTSSPKTRQAKPRQGYAKLMLLTLMLSLVATVVGGLSLYLHWQSSQPQQEGPILGKVEESEEVAYFTFGNYSLPIHESLSVNSYDQEAFLADANGIISYGDARLGIDVSQHQGEIDWQAVADAGVSFAMIRLGYRGYGQEGLILLDSYFYQNMTRAKAAGIDVGVYFFSQATSVWETLEEAYFVLEHLEGYELELPVVFNWEYIDNVSTARTNGIPGQSVTLFTQVFNEEMQKAGYDTMVYFSQSMGYLYLDLDFLADNPFWLASYRDSPNFYYDFDLWQYTDTGTIDGIEGYVDLNLMLKDITSEDNSTSEE